MVKSKAKSMEMRIIQVYMPTREHDDEEVEDMHEKIDQLLDDETNGKLYCSDISWDFSDVVGVGKEDGYVCHYGLGYRNDHRGQMLVAFAQQNLWQTPGLHSTE